MRASIKIFQRNNYSTKDGKRQLCLRYISFRQTTFLGLNISVHPRHWSAKRMMVLSGDRLHSHYNRIIEEEYHKAESIILANFHTPLTTKDFITRLKDKHYGNADFLSL